MSLVRDTMVAGGLILIAMGIWNVSSTLGLIATGVLLAGAGILWSITRRRR